EPHYGLGNRLRVLTGGLALSQHHSRTLVIAWGTDSHMGATFGDLFLTPPGVIVFDGFIDMETLGDNAKVYDCMDTTKKNVKHQKIKLGWNERTKMVVVKSAYPMQNKYGDFKVSGGAEGGQVHL
ncbi:hypothetical protein TrRE_jg12362, partial [Triparma retinervis]